MAEDGPVPARHIDGHPDEETLAAFDADALEPAAVALLRDHVDGCARCRAALADLQDVRARLAALPAPPLPTDVAARIDSALRTAGSDRAASAAVADLQTQRTRRTRRSRVGLAAAGLVVVAAAGVAFAITQAGGSHSTGSSAGSAARPVTSAPAPAGGGVKGPDRRTADTGGGAAANYTPTSLAAAIPSLVRTGGSRTGGGSGVMSDAARRAGCARALVGAGRPPLAVSHARFEGRDAYIFVFRTGTAHRAEVFVVGPGCAPADAARQFRTSAAY